MNSPLDIVITAALEHATDVAQTAVYVSGRFGPEAAAPLADYSNSIIDAIEQVRP